MKYIAITFDDGREDNYSVAMPVMKRYGMTGTVYVATGFVDGTWKESAVLESPRRALTPEEIRLLSENGWEIGLHGDRHTTELQDFDNAYRKLNQWLCPGENGRYGFSVPNSEAAQAEVDAIRSQKERVLYVRKGRRRPNAGLGRKLLYALSYYDGLQWAYDRYNRENVYLPDDRDDVMYSVVVKIKDRPETIVRFLDRLPDGAKVALMLHSVVPEAEARQANSAWVWPEKKFEALCGLLHGRGDAVRAVTARELAEMNR